MGLDRLQQKIREKKNPTVVGLDPKLAYLPQSLQDVYITRYGRTLEAAAEAILAYNRILIDALYDIVPAVKPQAAYYEMYGWQGMRALAETIRYAQTRGMFVITDGKRNDIGATMTAYAAAHLGNVDIDGVTVTPFGADALTVNGYLGTDGIAPLLDICRAGDKGIFVLVKTSNPSGGELQDKKIQEKTVYEIMGEMCETWGADQIGDSGYSAVGAVIGATYPEQLREMREKMPHTFFLVPGYGAQGGTAADVRYAFDRNSEGAVINSSRAILCAWQKGNDTDIATASRREAIRMRDEITSYL